MKIVKGDLFDYPVIGHGVNCRGLMGAGVAVGFRDRFPIMYENYRKLCRARQLGVGDVQVWYEKGILGFNIASQGEPGPNAKEVWLRQGLDTAAEAALDLGVTEIAIPLIGCGIGGLNREILDESVRYAEQVNPGFSYTIVTL